MSQIQSTRCPHCQTAFRVTPEQLAVAKGAVRCGSCLEVFNALEHPLHSPRAERTEPPARPQRQPDTTELASGFEAVDDPGVDHEFSAAADHTEDTFLFIDDQPEDLADRPVDEPSRQDDSLEFSDSFLSLDDNEPAPQAEQPTQPPQQQLAHRSQDADDNWPQQQYNGPDQHKPSEALPDDEYQALSTEPEDAWPDDFSPDYLDDSASGRSHDHTARSDQRFHMDTAFAAQDLDQLTQYQDSDTTHRRWPWILVSSLLVAVLIGQLAWWERDRLTQQPAIHVWYVAACSLLGCEVTEPAPDAGAIRALSSVLRPLPDGQMRLDAVFVNRSERPAPYPVLQLVIEDFQGTVTADGLFLPEDYLGGEVQPGDLMPPGRPVSISINMNRPVEELNNFRLTFHY